MSADELKAKGNAAFSAKNFPEAVKFFTEAIAVDGSNHVFYSNRSACYGSMGDYSKAFEDAKKCVELKGDWAKGYSRLGSALHGLRRYDEAISAFNQGLSIDGANDALKAGLAAAQQAKAQPPHPLAQLFTPELFTLLATSQNPKIKELREDQEFIGILNRVIADHSLIQQYLQDPRMLTLITSVTRAPGQDDDDEPPPKPKETPKPKEPEPEKVKTPEELEAEANKAAAEPHKLQGNTHYKAKEFDKAIECYKKASEVDPKNITYLNNLSAVYLEQKEYDQCLDMCDKAVELGRENHADFKDIAKALTRKGTCYQKQQDYTNALKWYNISLLEHRSADTLAKKNKCEAEEKAAKEAAYFSEELAEEAKAKGNEKFKAEQYKEAIDLYTEATKRNPKLHTVYSNRAAAYMKMGAYDDAEKDCQKCLKLEPKFTKAVTRLGHIYFFRKEYHKALVEYGKGLDLEPTNEECRNGKQRTLAKINEMSGGGEGDERARRAMADPEIQAILGDTYMQQVLRELSEDPKNIKQYMNSKDIMDKINKLIAAGVIKTA